MDAPGRTQEENGKRLHDGDRTLEKSLFQKCDERFKRSSSSCACMSKIGIAEHCDGGTKCEDLCMHLSASSIPYAAFDHCPPYSKLSRDLRIR